MGDGGDEGDGEDEGDGGDEGDGKEISLVHPSSFIIHNSSFI